MTGFPTSARPLVTAAAFVLGCCLLTPAVRADWLSYRGPSSTGASLEKGFTARFPLDGPRVLWKANVGVGTSSITVNGDRAYTMGNTGNHDRVFCFDVKTGAEV